NMSSLLIQVVNSPEPSRRPRLIAALWPPSRSLTHEVSHGEYFLMISTEPSVLPPSMTKYSRLGYPCSRIDRSVASTKCAWLNEGVPTLTRGHTAPSGIAGGNAALATVHGQPVRPGGGAGSSCRLGQCIQRLLREMPVTRRGKTHPDRR